MIFIVREKTGIAQTLQFVLLKEKYAVRLFNRASDVLAEAEKQPPALMLIEVSAANSNLDKYRLLRAAPALSRTPAILFSERASDQDRIIGLESGADDFLCQPFIDRELIARIQAVLRRFGYASPQLTDSFALGLRTTAGGLPQELITMGDIVIDTSAMRLTVRGSEIATTALEFRLIYYFVKHHHRVFTRDQLLDAVWGDKQFVTQRTVDACIRRIRRKIEPDRTRPTYLKTVRGAGYRFDLRTPLPHRPDDAFAVNVIRTHASPQSISVLRFPLKEA